MYLRFTYTCTLCEDIRTSYWYEEIKNNFSFLPINFFLGWPVTANKNFLCLSKNPSDILGEFYENWPFYAVLTLMGDLSSADCLNIWVLFHNKTGDDYLLLIFSSHPSDPGALWTALSQEEDEDWFVFGITGNVPFQFGQKWHNQATRH